VGDTRRDDWKKRKHRCGDIGRTVIGFQIRAPARCERRENAALPGTGSDVRDDAPRKT
jgi:hypothetical protein